MPGRSEFFRKAFPEALPTGSEEELKQKVKNQEHGVYYFEERGWIYFSVSGNCPNLTEDLSCKIHGERFYPRACINMIIKSLKCRDAQGVFKVNKFASPLSFYKD